MKRFAKDVALGFALALVILAIVILGTSGPKFIYIDF